MRCQRPGQVAVADAFSPPVHAGVLHVGDERSCRERALRCRASSPLEVIHVDDGRMAPPLQKYKFTSASVQVRVAGALSFFASCQAIKPGGGGAALSSVSPLLFSVAWHLMLNPSSSVMRGQRGQHRKMLFGRGLKLFDGASVLQTLASRRCGGG